MAEKLHEYQGPIGRIHSWRDKCRENWQEWKEKNPQGVAGVVRNLITKQPKPPKEDGPPDFEEYAHIYRRKTRGELVRVSAAVMGIEFSYAAETAFVSPTLLQIGVDHRHMTLVWALSPLVGFFLTPVLGSMSDQCRLKLGRRRPFIIMLAIGVLLGLILVPNGQKIGVKLGDYYPSLDPVYLSGLEMYEAHNSRNNTALNNLNNTNYNCTTIPNYEIKVNDINLNSSNKNDTNINNNLKVNCTDIPNSGYKMLSDADFPHPWGIFFTILGTVLLDFDADACQSPARAYLLDVSVSEDHAKGLSTFTVMAGLGGFLGYAMGGINWDVTAIGDLFGGHVRAVFSLITIIFIVCVVFTITAFKELPLDLLEKCEAHNKGTKFDQQGLPINQENIEVKPLPRNQNSYGSIQEHGIANENTQYQDTNYYNGEQVRETAFVDNIQTEPYNNSNNGHVNIGFEEELQRTQPPIVQPEAEAGPPPSLKEYLMSIVYMPNSLRVLCLTNLFCWMSHVCYSLYFTDFVGEAVFKGDPKAPEGTYEKMQYEEGVRFGCWGMSMYSLSCACYSTVIEKLIKKYKAKPVYVGGLLFYSVGMFFMAISCHRIGVILFSWTAGVMYSTLFTMPYLLVANYHQHNTFEVSETGESITLSRLRGLGTDVAIVSSMVFMAQFILSICMGTIITVVGSTTAVAGVASFLALCGAITATQVLYLDL